MLGYAAQIREHANLHTIVLQHKLRRLSGVVRYDHRVHDHACHLERHVTIKRSAAEILRAVFQGAVRSEDRDAVTVRQGGNTGNMITVFMANQNS